MNGEGTPGLSPLELHVFPFIFDCAAGETLSSQQLTKYIIDVAVKIKEKLNDKVERTAIVNNTIRIHPQHSVSEGWRESYVFEVCGVIADVTGWKIDDIWPHAPSSMRWVIDFSEDGLPIFIEPDPTTAG